MQGKTYVLQNKRTESIILSVTDDKDLFFKEAINCFKKRLFSIYTNKNKRFVDEKELFEELDLLKKIKDNIVLAEENKPNSESDIIKLLTFIGDELDIEVNVENVNEQNIEI
ncbi:hypothetical protein ACQ1X9_11830 [Staphylococcus cohnii]|uniref:hypothetical protein n=1 Tax=Staphylococcus cohnii TaxID=29382 RepID=UPI003D7DF741